MVRKPAEMNTVRKFKFRVVARFLVIALVFGSVGIAVELSSIHPSGATQTSNWARQLWICSTGGGKSIAYSSASEKLEVVGFFKKGVTKSTRTQVGSWLGGDLAYCIGSLAETRISGKNALTIYSTDKQRKLYQSFALELLKGSGKFQKVKVAK